ncbi:MFS transporter [Paraburkholderia caribensis]|uniref:MFS transporter n=1 Tax=Paraburkholderia caribensis TaxID=75105 RepID=UPI001CAAFF03|nr:MFS transporter [Paraburkholderia caribensis]CAG9249583.1 Major facilitator superfamily metabolite/H(+) symporter [Paraburkholderia caribensis]
MNTASNTAVAASPSAGRKFGSSKMTLGLMGGVALEWYDWNIYGVMAAFLSPRFFPSHDPAVSLLAALAVFGAGFFARPIGAALLGPIADRISHRGVMLLSVSAMAICSLVIALMPAYGSIGVWAGVILLALRLIQGLATGAEAGVANSIASELAPPGREGRYMGLIGGTSIQIGIVGSSLVALIVSLLISKTSMQVWGWRIPFAVGGVLGLVVIYLRSSLPETLIVSAIHAHSATEDTRIHRRTRDVWKQLWDLRLALLAVTMVIGSVQIANYAWITGLPSIANSIYKEESSFVFGITMSMGFIWMFSGPFIGALADRIRPSRAFVIFRLMLVPAFFLMWFYAGNGIGRFALVMIVGGTIVGFNMSLYNYIAVTLMPRSIRTTGVAVGYALGVSIFGGTSPYLLLWLRHNEAAYLFPVYGAVVAVLSVIVYLIAKRCGHLYVAN